MQNILRFVSVGGLLALVACEGPPGASGANGLDGEDGANGANGPAGQDGLDGDDGIGGPDGPAGPAGADGHDGRDGHDGNAPWGVNVTIVSVGGATGATGAFQVGDIPTVTFSVLDDAGNEYDLSELADFDLQLSGPTSHYQNVVNYAELAAVKDTAVYNFDGTWTYTYSLPIPATYDNPLNDTTDLGSDEGDLGGLPLDDGTYTVAAWAYVNVTLDDGSSLRQASNTTQDVLFGAATVVEPREVVLAENCAQCHGDEFLAHGGSRRDFDVCITCHVDGAEDRFSATDPSVTPGLSIGIGQMVHGIHNGASLVNGYTVAGFPSDPGGIGYPDYNLVDFGDVVFPNWPMEAATCDSCHGGAADGDVENRPTRQACGACHDGVDFTQVDTLALDYHPGGPQADDTNCTVCHTAAAVLGAHDDPRTTDAIWTGAGHAAGKTGVNVEVLTAVDQDGSTTFDVGDSITVRFTVKYDDGTDIPQAFFAYSATSSTCPTVAGGATAKFAGPSDHMQQVLGSPSPSSTTVVGSVFGSSTVNGQGVWTYTFRDTAGAPLTIPATFPFQENDDLLVGTEWGDLVGQPLADGTYRLALDLYTAMWDDPTCAVGSTRWRQSSVGYIDVLVGAATTLEPHAVVDDAACESCHTNLEFHGATRSSVDYCVTCHTPGAADNDVNPLVTVDFPVMIHKIHASDMLENGYVVDGTSFDVVFPRQDGGVAACTACHGTNTAYLDPSTRGCVTCHDSDATQAHAALNTDPTFGEACDVCHGAGSTFSVETMHAFPM